MLDGDEKNHDNYIKFFITVDTIYLYNYNESFFIH